VLGFTGFGISCNKSAGFFLPMLLYLDLLCWDLRVLGFHATYVKGA
jgi:hypothetical protein